MVTECHGAKKNNTVQKSLTYAAKRVLKIYKSNSNVDFLLYVFKHLSCRAFLIINCQAKLYLLINPTIFIGTCSCYSNTHTLWFIVRYKFIFTKWTCGIIAYRRV